MGPKRERRLRRLAEEIDAQPSGVAALSKGELISIAAMAILAAKDFEGDVEALVRRACATAGQWCAYRAAWVDGGGVVVPEDEEDDEDRPLALVGKEVVQR